MGHHTNPIAETEGKMNQNSVNLNTQNSEMCDKCDRTQSYNKCFQTANHKAVPQQRGGAIEQVSDTNTFHGNV